jgi:hypothetical protein
MVGPQWRRDRNRIVTMESPMAFSDLAQLIKDNGNGVRAFEKAAEEAFAAASKNPELAAAYFVLGSEAADFSDVYDRMPVTKVISDAAQERFAEHAAKLDAAFEDPSSTIAALNKIVTEILTDR